MLPKADPPSTPIDGPLRAQAALRVSCVAVLFLGFLSYIKFIDRYPVSYVDEPFFNWAAINALEGKSLTYNSSSRAPHRDRLWAYHSPFFPRMQVATFRLLGVGRFAARIPQYVASYIAISIICAFLMRRRLNASALIAAIAWLGDRSSQEVLYGRMEGLALLSVATGYVAILKYFETLSLRWAALVGLGLGSAVGFHPVTYPFVVASGLLLATSLRGTVRGRALIALVAGGMVPLALWLWCWMPDLSASFEQFRWHTRMVTRRSLGVGLGNLVDVLGWARYWFLMLVLAVITLLVPLVILRLSARGRATVLGDRRESAWFLACLFSVVGLICLCSSPLLPYYLVHFTVWPVLALSMTIEAGLYPRRWRLWVHTVAALVVLGWLPSAAWNALRFREVVNLYRALDSRVFARQIGPTIPRGAPVMGTPELAMLAKEVGLNFSPLPWYPEQARVRPDAWLLLDEKEYRGPRYVAPESIACRRVILAADGFPGARPYLNCPFVLLGPASVRPVPAPDASPP
jgi:hypothetical protein